MNLEEIKKLGLNTTIRDLQALYKKVNKKVKQARETKFKVVINGDEYESVNEVLDAYGSDIITESQKDNALRKFDENESIDAIRVLNTELDLLNDIIAALIDKRW